VEIAIGFLSIFVLLYLYCKYSISKIPKTNVKEDFEKFVKENNQTSLNSILERKLNDFK